MTTASLIESVSISGYGASAASGSAYFFQPGTTAQATVYQDGEGATVYTQPVVLDSNGRSFVPVFALGPVRMQVFSAGGVLLVDSDQENVVTASQVAINNAGWAADLSDALDAVTASFGTTGALVKMPGSTTVVRTLQDKLSEAYVSVKDFGAKGDDRTDDTAAIQAAFSYVQNIGAGEIRFPVGTYKITSGIAFSLAAGSLKITGAGRATVLKNYGGGTNMLNVSALSGSLFVQSMTFSGVSGADNAIVASVNNVIVVDCYGLNFSTADMIVGPGTGGAMTCIACQSYNSVGSAKGKLALINNTGVNVCFLGCAGEVTNVSADAVVNIFGSTQRKTDTSGSGSAAMQVFGGSGQLVTTANTPSVFPPNGQFPYSTDSATDNIKTIVGTATVNLKPVQSMIVLNATLAGITVTYAISIVSPLGRNVQPQTICFFNNTAGAVTWTNGGGFTLRGAAPAPAAGVKVYITFAYDPVLTSYVETSRT